MFPAATSRGWAPANLCVFVLKGDQFPSGQGAAENIATATAVDPTTGMSIGEPYGFTHVTHVSYSEASGFVVRPSHRPPSLRPSLTSVIGTPR